MNFGIGSAFSEGSGPGPGPPYKVFHLLVSISRYYFKVLIQDPLQNLKVGPQDCLQLPLMNSFFLSEYFFVFFYLFIFLSLLNKIEIKYQLYVKEINSQY